MMGGEMHQHNCPFSKITNCGLYDSVPVEDATFIGTASAVGTELKTWKVAREGSVTGRGVKKEEGVVEGSGRAEPEF